MQDWGVWLVLAFIVLGISGLVLLSVWGREQSLKLQGKQQQQQQQQQHAAAASVADLIGARKLAEMGGGPAPGPVAPPAPSSSSSSPSSVVATHGSTAHGVRTVPKPVGAPETDVLVKAGTGAGAAGSAAGAAALNARPGAPVSTSHKSRPGRTRPSDKRGGDQSFKKEWSKPDDKLLDLLASGRRSKTPYVVPANPIRVSLEYPALAGSPGQFQRYGPNATNRPTVQPCELEGLYVDSSRYYGISSQTCAAVHPRELAAQNDPQTVV